METPNPPTTPANQTPATPRRRAANGCLVLVFLVIVSMLAAGITVWWMLRPIKPVVLAPPESAVLEQKIARIAAAATPRETAPQTTGGSAAPATTTPPAPPAATHAEEPDRPYTPGDRTLRLSERELNALLHQNTDLGETVRLELGRDAINAYLAMPIPEDFPIGGGQTLRARGRFLVSIEAGKAPMAVLEDVTVFGLSLPKAWLGGVKGENLLADAVGERDGHPLVEGIRSLKVEPGQLVLEVEE